MSKRKEGDPLGAIFLNRKDLHDLNGGVLSLIWRNIITSTFIRDLDGKEVEFPKKRKANYLDMIFSLDRIELTEEEKEVFGEDASCGLRVVQRRKDLDPDMQDKGLEVEVHLVVLCSQRVIEDYESIEMLKVDLDTGEAIHFQDGLMVEDSKETEKAKKWYSKQFRKRNMPLIGASYSFRDDGSVYRLKL